MSKETPDGVQIFQMYDLQGAIVTASASLTTGTAATLIAGDSDYYLDLIKVSATSTSTVALGTTGFNVALTQDGSTMANYPMGHTNWIDIDYMTPLKQNTKNIAWVVDLDDVTGTTVNLTALFVKRAR